jgi:YegS/Rv2252/BmrU family lipid kinase
MPESPRTIHVIVNPAAGRGAARGVRREVERALARRGVDFTIAETTGPGEAIELARVAARGGASVIAAVGGDGTVHEVVNGLLAESSAAPTAALGVVPVGTGNDFVKLVAGLRTRDGAYDVLAHGIARPMDTGLASWAGGEEYFVNAMGTGIDVEVVRQIQRMRNLPGAAVYVLGLAKALVRFRPIAVRVTVDGDSAESRVMMVAVANGICIGGAFRVSPGALPDDGLFDVVQVAELGLFDSLRVAPRILRGTHLGLAAVRHRTAKTVELEVPADATLFFQLDGELREPGVRRVRVDVRPASLRVLAAPHVATAARARLTGNPMGEVM